MTQQKFRCWEVHASALPDSPLVGEVFFPVSSIPIDADSRGNDSSESLESSASCDATSKRASRRNNRTSFAKTGFEKNSGPAETAGRSLSPSGRHSSVRNASSTPSLLLPRFRYSTAWLEGGFALGADLPLTPGLQAPLRGRRSFGFLTDRRLSDASTERFRAARREGSESLAALPALDTAGDEEAAAVLLPNAAAHAGGIEFSSPEAACGTTLRLPYESTGLGSVFDALASEGRRRASLKTLLALASATVLPGGRTALALVTESGESALTVRSPTDLIDFPLWRRLFLELAHDCGIECAESRLIHAAGMRALFTQRVDRTEDAEHRQRLTLSGTTLSPERALSYLGIAEILNREGAAPSQDLPQVWRRMVFALLTGAEDRGAKWLFHRTQTGWRLAKAHGFSPCAGAPRPMTADGRRHLASLDDAVRLAPYFGMRLADAKTAAAGMRRALRDWEERALELGADVSEVELLAPGFEAF